MYDAVDANAITYSYAFGKVETFAFSKPTCSINVQASSSIIYIRYQANNHFLVRYSVKILLSEMLSLGLSSYYSERMPVSTPLPSFAIQPRENNRSSNIPNETTTTSILYSTPLRRPPRPLSQISKLCPFPYRKEKEDDRRRQVFLKKVREAGDGKKWELRGDTVSENSEATKRRGEIEMLMVTCGILDTEKRLRIEPKTMGGTTG